MLINLFDGWMVDDSGRLVRPDGSVCGPDEPISAGEVWQSLRIPVKTTLFFNHSGFVPARSVVDDALRRQPAPRGRPRKNYHAKLIIRINEEQHNWVKSQPGNVSDVIRELVDNAIKPPKKPRSRRV